MSTNEYRLNRQTCSGIQIVNCPAVHDLNEWRRRQDTLGTRAGAINAALPNHAPRSTTRVAPSHRSFQRGCPPPSPPGHAMSAGLRCGKASTETPRSRLKQTPQIVLRESWGLGCPAAKRPAERSAVGRGRRRGCSLARGPPRTAAAKAPFPRSPPAPRGQWFVADFFLPVFLSFFLLTLPASLPCRSEVWE